MPRIWRHLWEVIRDFPEKPYHQGVGPFSGLRQGKWSWSLMEEFQGTHMSYLDQRWDWNKKVNTWYAEFIWLGKEVSTSFPPIIYKYRCRTRGMPVVSWLSPGQHLGAPAPLLEWVGDRAIPKRCVCTKKKYFLSRAEKKNLVFRVWRFRPCRVNRTNVGWDGGNSE